MVAWVLALVFLPAIEPMRAHFGDRSEALLIVPYAGILGYIAGKHGPPEMSTRQALFWNAMLMAVGGVYYFFGLPGRGSSTRLSC